MKRRWYRSLLQRRVWVMLLLAAQLAMMIFLTVNSSLVSQAVNLGLRVLGVAVAICVMNREEHPSYRLVWVFVILALPLFGGLFYLTCVYQSSTRRFRKDAVYIDSLCRAALKPTENCLPTLKPADNAYPIAHYLQESIGFPLYRGGNETYFPTGEAFFEALLRELETAKHYIFLEYYIIRDGKMWSQILEILQCKAADGVEVRILYDDFGCFLSLPPQVRRNLETNGIQCRVFNRFRPILSTVQNNRDHRKILIVDGTVGFTGGINLSDEYINATSPLGHWKDAAVMLYGESVRSLLYIFFSLWYRRNDRYESIDRFLPPVEANSGTDGFCQPFADSPMDETNVSEHVFLRMIYRAKREIFIQTPYLVLDDALTNALTGAAESGIDVRILVPSRGDNPLVSRTMRSYYPHLITAGVKLYTYTPGFVHAKTIVVDGESAVVGTVNFDYRSLYLQFECGVW
ncbi:MAG: cardiolipin synthase, partial [Clostridia bacterium]|nr:cardiolipin synthase [Clostridia bacterium]